MLEAYFLMSAEVTTIMTTAQETFDLKSHIKFWTHELSLCG